MAIEQIQSDDALVVAQRAMGLEAEFLPKVEFAGLIGKGASSIIQMKDELEEGPGDTIIVGLRRQGTTAPKTSGEKVEGAEGTYGRESMSFVIDEYVDAYRFEGIMSPQRVNYTHRDEGRAYLSDLLSNSVDTSLANQICSVAPAGGEATFRGNNPIKVPDADGTTFVFPSGITAEADITATDGFALEQLMASINRAKNRRPQIRPGRIKGFKTPMYAVGIHPNQNHYMRINDTRWKDLTSDTMRAGIIARNPAITGALAIYEGCLIFESTRIASPGLATDGTTIYRAAFMGAQSAMCAYGRFAGTPEKFRWVEKHFDYDREYGVMAGFVWGASKTYFAPTDGSGTNRDFATLLLPSAGLEG